MHYCGLVVFILVVVANVAGLLYDGYLLLTGQTTITERVWNNPTLGLPIILLQVAALLGIVVHFYTAKGSV